jgi:hypothetical protein
MGRDPGAMWQWSIRDVDLAYNSPTDAERGFWSAVFSKLLSSDRVQQDYAFNYFTHFIDKCHEAPPASLKIAVISGLKKGDLRFKSLAESWKDKAPR